jgi:hypothetical protein
METRSEIKDKSKSLAILTLKDIRHMPKSDLIEIILIREIAFNDLREEWKKLLIQNTKDDFSLLKIDVALSNDKKLMTEYQYKRTLMKLRVRINQLLNIVRLQNVRMKKHGLEFINVNCSKTDYLKMKLEEMKNGND